MLGVGALRQGVFHRVVMDVVEVLVEVVLIADRVLPKPQMPDVAIAVLLAGGRNAVGGAHPMQRCLVTLCRVGIGTLHIKRPAGS